MKIMAPSNKTLIPLIIVFFIFGFVVGYVAHKPEMIEKIVEKKTIITVTVTVTPTPTFPLTPTPTPTATPIVSDFTVKDYYDPAKEAPTRTIVITTNYAAEPKDVSIHQGESVLIKITEYTLSFSLELVLNNSYKKYLGASGSAFVTFNKKGTYPYKAIFSQSDPTIKPTTYAEGTIIVY